jgi:hypothetical protein
MRRPAIVRREPTAQIGDDFQVDLTADALLSVIAGLRYRVERSGTRCEVAQVVLAGAHIDEAIGLLRKIQPARSLDESGSNGLTTPPARRAHRSLLRAGHPHPARAVGT